MTTLEQKLQEMIAPIAQDLGFDLVRIRLSGAKNLTLQVMAERPDRTMTAEDCARLSRAISPMLEERDPIAGAYTLEVSSPGVDRPLVRLADYADFEGHEAKIEIDRMAEGRKRFRGILAGIDGEHVCLDMEGEDETVLLPFAWIVSGKLILTDQLIAQSLKAAKTAAAPDMAQHGEINDHH